MTPPESPLIKSMANLRDSFAQRAHEIDAKQQQALLDALHQLYTSTQSLSNHPTPPRGWAVHSATGGVAGIIGSSSR